MTTMADIADRLGISKSTVSKALSGASDISETLRKTILETAVEMGYTKLKRYRDSGKHLCIFIENMEYTAPSHFGYEIVMGFRQLAEPEGCSVDIIEITEQMQKETGYDIYMIENGYVGAFFLGMSLSDPWHEELKTSRTPAALYDNYVANPNTAYIGVDTAEGMNLILSYLKKQGHRRIGYLSTGLGSYVVQQRYRAFYSALHRYGLHAESSVAADGYFILECIQKHLPHILDQKITALICSHDQLANAAMIQCKEMGYRIPDDLSIIGFDDLPIAAYTSPPLTTIRQDRLNLGKCGYYALQSLLSGVPVSTLLLHAQLMIRQSSGPAKKTGVRKQTPDH